MSGHRRAREIARALEAGGWTVERSRGGHLIATHPDAAGRVVFGSTPSDGRVAMNVRAAARRALRQQQEAS